MTMNEAMRRGLADGEEIDAARKLLRSTKLDGSPARLRAHAVLMTKCDGPMPATRAALAELCLAATMVQASGEEQLRAMADIFTGKAQVARQRLSKRPDGLSDAAWAQHSAALCTELATWHTAASMLRTAADAEISTITKT